eukprot:TRINITY_DN16930_c0_g1_i1.p1 TRINITY_DN16930_c0_g1~~TRINITY_DN16930_c0_g1_i1.p1  ORF type:complete len:304 (+),score=63.97 TRINITY_DN16930_c0_g1_i1:213-1124(+)
MHWSEVFNHTFSSYCKASTAVPDGGVEEIVSYSYKTGEAPLHHSDVVVEDASACRCDEALADFGGAMEQITAGGGSVLTCDEDLGYVTFQSSQVMADSRQDPFACGGKDDRSEYDELQNLLVLGDPRRDRSALIECFCESGNSVARSQEPSGSLPRREETAENTEQNTLLGSDCKETIIERRGKRLKLRLLDTSGERFNDINPVYYRAAMGFCLCVDLTDRASFELARYWLRQSLAHADESVPKIVIGTGLECDEERQVSPQEASAFAHRYGLSFFAVSSKTGAGIGDAILHLADLVNLHRNF